MRTSEVIALYEEGTSIERISELYAAHHNRECIEKITKRQALNKVYTIIYKHLKGKVPI